nr:PREDICTED: innexin shaking-B isoform X2 [Megachile rotundata]
MNNAINEMNINLQVSKIRNDGAIFRLHSLTTILILTFSLIISSKQVVGNPIECIHTREIPVEAFNSYCWIHSTYFVTGAMLGNVGVNVAAPGIAPSYQSFQPNQSERRKNGAQTTTKNVKYYQWVLFVLVFQAILFYTPRWLWKGWEGGKIHALMMDLDIGLCSEVEKKQKKKMLLDYLWENLRYHNWWAYRYYLCEVLALLNVIGQMFLMNRFFDGAFLTFGIDVLRFLESDQEDRVDPMIYVFPRMTKCTFYKYGVSGEVERHDAVCILPLNVVNEKIYVFLWFWFLFLGVLSFITVLYRIVIIFSPRTRVYLLRLRFRLVRREAIETIVRRSKVGDWFLLYMLGENLDTVIYKDVMHELANKLASRHHHSVPGIKGELQEA